jgi:transposase
MPKQLVLRGKETREDFLLLFKKCKDIRLRERYHALYLGFSYDWKEIADILGVDYETIIEWVHLYNEQGIGGIEPGRPPGRPSSLTKEQVAEVKKSVMRCPRDMGLKFSNWTVGRICRWMAGKFGVLLSDERVRQVLHAIGFSYVKPAYSYLLAKEEERKAFLSGFREVANGGGVYLFEDESTVHQHPTLHGMWVLKGSRARIGTFGNHAKRHAFSAVNPIDGTHIGMVAKRLTAETFVRFLRKVLDAVTVPFTLIMDNSPCHKAKLVTEFLEKRKHMINVLWLPRFSPDLNPDEQVWKDLKLEVSHNHMFGTPNKLAWGMIGYFRRLGPEKVKSLCSTDYLFGKL